MKKQANAHDALFKQSMRHPEIARDWFRSHVPEAIWSRVDPNSLCLMDKEFTVPHGRELRSDLLYRVKFIDKEEYLYLLVEHQSTPNRFMAVRITEYSLAVIQQYPEQGAQHVPLVLAFCIYHGKMRPYPFSTNCIDCFNSEYKKLDKGIISHEFYLVDLTTRPSDCIHGDGLASLFQHLLKCRYEKNQLEFLKRAKLEPCVAGLDKQFKGNRTYARACAYYVINELGEGHPGELDEKLAILSTILPITLQGDIMTFARQLRQRGREEGIQEGIQEGLQEGIRKGKLEGIREGIQKGKLEGKLEGQEAIAITLLKRAFPLDDVGSITGLPLERLEQLLKG